MLQFSSLLVNLNMSLNCVNGSERAREELLPKFGCCCLSFFKNQQKLSGIFSKFKLPAVAGLLIKNFPITPLLGQSYLARLSL